MTYMDNNTVLLFNHFIPENGFSLKYLLGTSFGFDPNVALTALLFSSGEVSDDFFAGSLENHSKEVIREALKTGIHKSLFLVARDGKVNMEFKTSGAFQRILMDRVSLVRARSPTLGSFHPKMLCAVYEDQNGKVEYGRLYVGSKNFSRSDAYEFGVVFNLVKNGDTNFSNSLSNVISSFSKEVKGHKERLHLKQVVGAVRESSLGVKDKGIELSFYNRNSSRPLLYQWIEKVSKYYDCVDIHSPWVDLSCLGAAFRQDPPLKVRVKCLPYKQPKEEARIARDFKVAYQYDGELEDSGFYPGQSHAKIIYLSGGNRRPFLIFGSANFTKRGLGLRSGANTELMIGMRVGQGDYKHLCIRDTLKNHEDIHSTSNTDIERALQALHQVEIDFDHNGNTFSYTLSNKSTFPIHLQHPLIEPINGVSALDVHFKKGETGPKLIKYDGPFSHICSFVILHQQIGPDAWIKSFAKIVLPPDFYDARSDLNRFESLRLKTIDLVNAILEIMDISFDSGVVGSTSSASTQSESEKVRLLLENLPLDVLAYRLARLKNDDRSLFESKFSRLERIVEEFEALDGKGVSNFLEDLKVVKATIENSA